MDTFASYRSPVRAIVLPDCSPDLDRVIRTKLSVREAARELGISRACGS